MERQPDEIDIFLFHVHLYFTVIFTYIIMTRVLEMISKVGVNKTKKKRKWMRGTMKEGKREKVVMISPTG